MIYVKSFDQETGNCGPASLKIVLSFFGINKSEKELVKLTGSNKKNGTNAQSIVKAVKKLGLKAFIKDFSDFKDIKKYILKEKIPIIVNWFSKDDGHFSVVVDIDSENIYLQDPEIGTLRAIELKLFKRIWFDFSGDYLKSKNDITLRRIIVIKK